MSAAPWQWMPFNSLGIPKVIIMSQKELCQMTPDTYNTLRY